MITVILNETQEVCIAAWKITSLKLQKKKDCIAYLVDVFLGLNFKLFSLSICVVYGSFISLLPLIHYQGEQRGRSHAKWWTWLKFKKVYCFAFSLSVPAQLILKYTYMLEVLIHHIVHMTHFDYTLPILQKFEKTKFPKSTSLNSIQVFCTQFVFSKRKSKKFVFFKLELTLSVYMQSAVLLTPDYRTSVYKQCKQC